MRVFMTQIDFTLIARFGNEKARRRRLSKNSERSKTVQITAKKSEEQEFWETKARRRESGMETNEELGVKKDFNSSAGGLLFGEVGLQSFKETGRVPTRTKRPTIGWGPGVILSVVALAGASLVMNDGGALTVESLEESVQSAVGAVSSIDVSTVAGKVGDAVETLDESASMLPLEVRSIATQAALVGFGVIGLYVLFGKIVSSVKRSSGDFLKVALLALACGFIAEKILSS